ncbi:MAG: transporter [Streptococcaceae bacterium]|jgi:ABC-2 type transport system permease protein|nr:transporter [Streptococcaceae bacterium]
MLNAMKSEALKLKNSFSVYILMTFFLLELLTIPVYLMVNHGRVLGNNLLFLSMLAYPILTSILSILSCEQEEMANHFQEINGYFHPKKIWIAKILMLDILWLFPTVVIWLAVGNLLAALATWLLALFLTHFQMLLSTFLGRGGNLVVAFVEVLVIIFASNRTFLGMYWNPVALPVNLVLDVNKLGIISLVIWNTLVFLGVLMLAHKNAGSVRKN